MGGKISTVLDARSARIAEWPEWSVTRLAVRKAVSSLIRVPEYIQDQCTASVVDVKTNSRKVITEIPPCGITISKPGTYRLQHGVKWRPSGPDMAAIRIVCSDVTLDLQTNTLEKHAASAFKGCAGIVAVPLTAEPLSNVTICCGFVRNFDVYGVAAFGVDHITLERLVVQNLRNADMAINSVGLFLAGCDYSTISWCACEKSRVVSIAHSALQLRFCDNTSVSDCRVLSQQNDAGGCVGISAVGCADIQFLRNHVGGIHVGEVLAPHSSGQTALGMFPMVCVRVRIKDCHVSRVTGSCDDAHGLSIFICPADVTVSACTFDQINTGFRSATLSGAKVTGVEVMLSTAVVVETCKVKNITGSSPQDGQVAGYSSGGTSHVTFSRCSARHISCGDTPGSGVGFGWAPDPRKVFIALSENTVFSTCVAQDCDIAFDLFMHKDAKIIDCKGKNTRKLLLFNDPAVSRTLTCNACSECPIAKRTVVRNTGSGNRGQPVEV